MSSSPAGPTFANQIGDQPIVESGSSPSEQLSYREKFIWLLVTTLLISIRIPNILKGRIWAEEGSTFLVRAWDQHWYQSLLVPYGGYLNLVATTAAILAKNLVPLDKACYVTTGLSLLLQLCPILIICFSKDEWLQSRKSLAIALLLVISMPMCEGVWLNTLGSQCHLNLCTGLILALTVRTGAVGYFHGFLLALTTLCGLGPIVLVPMFAIRAYLERSKQRAIQCAILIAGLTTQFCFFVRMADRNVGGGKDAAFGIDPLLLLNIFYVKHIISPLLGFQEASRVAGSWMTDYSHGTFNLIPGSIVTILVFALFAYMVWRAPGPETKWLALAGLALSSIAYFGALADRYMSLGVGINSRYAFAPQILFELSLLSIALTTKGWKSALSGAVVIWVLIIGMHEFFFVSPVYSDGPSWRSEIRQWQANPDYEIKLWPAGWAMKLKPHT